MITEQKNQAIGLALKLYKEDKIDTDDMLCLLHAIIEETPSVTYIPYSTPYQNPTPLTPYVTWCGTKTNE